MSDTIQKIHIELPQSSYDILIGRDLFTNALDDLLPFIEHRQIIIISDEQVADLYLQPIEHALAPHARAIHHALVPAGEASKSFAYFEKLVNEILALNIDRRSLIIALGGGVVGDLAGYVAASLLRGIDFIQVPTSLLAQVDSSFGGKTGINTSAGKNLVGAFYQPRLVLADIDMLSSLPLRELKAGYAEVVKYGLLGDAEFFDWLEVNGAELLAGNPDKLAEAVRISCQAKADIVRADEKESGQRALLNLGHTFAHALEAEAGYDGRLLHGEAVACGLRLAFGFSRHLGLSSGQDEMRVAAHLNRLGLPGALADLPVIADMPIEKMIDHMRKDKKARDGKLTFILVHSIGQAFVEHEIDEQSLREFLESCR